MHCKWRVGEPTSVSAKPSATCGGFGVALAAARRSALTRPRPGHADLEPIGWRHPISEVTFLSGESATRIHHVMQNVERGDQVVVFA